MIYFALLKRYFIFAVIAFAFVTGYYIKGKQVQIKQQKELINLINRNDKIAQEFEKERAKIESEFNNIDLKVTYEKAGFDCAIPSDGLRILSEATR